MVPDPRTIVHRFTEELWNARDLSVADAIIDPSCVTHQLRSSFQSLEYVRGPESLKTHVGEFLAAFPDLRLDVEQQIAEGDFVVTWCVFRGTHNGTWLGIPATGRQVIIRSVVTHRIHAGKIAEDWVLSDFYGVFADLGLIPRLQELTAMREQQP